MNSMTETRFVWDFITMADDGWKQGWHECNGGNLSYRLTKKDVKLVEGFFKPGKWKPIGACVPGLAREHFLISSAGSHFRNFVRHPEECMGVVQVDGSGERYRRCWGFAGGGRPTSELSAHLMIHEVKKKATGGKSGVVYHAHPANIAVLTTVAPCSAGGLTKMLWRMISECAIVFPEGVGVVEWMVPGSRELAEASAKEMERRNAVVWPHHGMVCAGASFDDAFGLMHTVEKAAEILVKAKSMHVDASGQRFITDDNLKELSDSLGLKLAER